MVLFGWTGSSATAMWISLGLLIYIPFSHGSDVGTLEVQYTVYQGPDGKLQFQQTTLFNGHVIFSCNGQTLRDQPQQDWVTQAFTQEELEERHQQCKSQCYKHITSYEKIKRTITVSADILQRRRGYSISSSGKSSFDEWGVNGEDFLTFDPNSLKWTAQTDDANLLEAWWDGEHHMNYAYKAFLNILYSELPILKTKLAARPSVEAHAGVELHTFADPIAGGTVSYLQCHVTGISLSEVSIQLTKDGVPLGHGFHQIGPLPNGDGTAQMRVLVKTTIDSSKTYRCEGHSETFNKSVVFDDPSPHRSTEKRTLPYVTGIIICIVVILGILIGYPLLVLHVRKMMEVTAAKKAQKTALIV
ncbi:major histocompatibility complex class I-related gene protein-like [Sardina pilchardus]|uniref:major histocompatibility complex class I-related gene protein-like n=1 Tax=Sardina pilchardus TaxID=27697 RepID=UPI002E0DD0CC